MKKLSAVLIVLVLGLVLVAAFCINDRPRRRKESYPNPVLSRIRDNFKILHPRFGNVPLYEGDSSFTEDKKTITLCLRDPQSGSVYDMNTLMYVSLHELAHIITKEYDEHGPEYKKNFKMLLDHAQKLGIFDPTKGIEHNYCGIKE